MSNKLGRVLEVIDLDTTKASHFGINVLHALIRECFVDPC